MNPRKLPTWVLFGLVAAGLLLFVGIVANIKLEQFQECRNKHGVAYCVIAISG